MAIRKYKPTTPGRRGSSVADFAEITRSTPEKSLVEPLPKKGGRNNQGRITTRHQGGGHKRAYRIIDFKRYDKDGVPAKVAHIEYDPNRIARRSTTVLRCCSRWRWPAASRSTTRACPRAASRPWPTRTACARCC